MKSLSALIAALLLYSSGFAQTSLGIKAGICLPNLKGKSSLTNPIANNWSSRLGPYAGVVAVFHLSNRFSLQTELNYSSQGGKKKGKQTIATATIPYPIPPGVPVPDYLYANIDAEAILNYIELPILAAIHFNLDDKWQLFANAGPYIGYLLNAKTISKGSSIIYLDEAHTQPLTPAPVNLDMTVDIKDELNRVNTGVQFGLGMAYKLPKGSLRVTGGANIGITSIQKDKSNGENSTGAPTITLAYLYNL
ncbi:porin family protein [Foetidibacter luteolus]|uniref:porin family protein n=1 Tax=Foetidibacter luteolus TaxID=2608880 RepID=UPI00129AA98D|nr:porin family protein [Foetidibacter luteolus]